MCNTPICGENYPISFRQSKPFINVLIMAYPIMHGLFSSRLRKIVRHATLESQAGHRNQLYMMFNRSTSDRTRRF